MDFTRSIILFNHLQKSVNVERRFLELLDQCEKENKKFCDSCFYPTIPPNDDDNALLQGTEWKYVEDVYSDNNLFDDINPKTIVQGDLGDCYFISALIYISNYPELVKTLFHPKSSLKYGIVLIYFKIMGESLPIIVDTQLPFIKDDKEPNDGTNEPKLRPKFAFARNNSATPAWFALIEKAYAKVCGGFTTIESGRAHIVIHNLFGWFSTAENYKDERIDSDKLFNTLEQLYYKESMLSGGIKYDYLASEFVSPQDFQDITGLVISHEYQILSVKEACGMKFIKLRNPWAQFEWKGDYSKNSNKWTEELKLKLSYYLDNDVNDGVFWMRFEDFYHYFSEITYSIPPKEGSFIHSFCGVIDGYLDKRSACSGCKNAGCLPQWNINFSNTGTIRIHAEIAGPQAFHGINIAYNNGEKVQTLTTDMKCRRDGNDCEINGFLYDIDQIDQPWTVFLDRSNGCSEQPPKPSYFRITIESDSDFTVQKIIYNYSLMHSTSASGVFLPGGDDGWNPFGGKPLDSCRQWSFKFTKPTKLFVRVFKNVSSSQHYIIFGNTNEKISEAYTSLNCQYYRLNAVTDYEEVVFDVKNVDKAYSFCIFRDKSDDVSRYKFVAYSDNIFEFKELPDGKYFIYKEDVNFPEIARVKQPDNFKPIHYSRSSIKYTDYQLPSSKFNFLNSNI